MQDMFFVNEISLSKAHDVPAVWLRYIYYDTAAANQEVGFYFNNFGVALASPCERIIQ